MLWFGPVGPEAWPDRRQRGPLAAPMARAAGLLEDQEPIEELGVVSPAPRGRHDKRA